MKIVCLASDPVIDEYLKPLNKDHDLVIDHVQNLTDDEVETKAKDAEVLITGPEVIKLSSALLSKLPELKLLAVLTIGTDWIDIDYCRGNGIVVSNIHGATAESVAEHAWAMILDLSKRVSQFDREARFDGAYNFSLYKGKEVYGKTLGVLGLGSIGKKVTRIALGFNMDVVGVNNSGKMVDGVKLVSKDELLAIADVIAVCLPLNNDTEGYISAREFEMMKDGVVLVNCAREKIVDKEAVLAGLESGKVFGYGVETPIMQEISKDDPYYLYGNVIVVPHNAFNTVEGDEKTYALVVENIESFVDGKPQNIVV